MPQSLGCILIHVVFSTKNRAPALTPTVRPALFAYLAVISRKAGCECYRVGGIEDHVHLAIRLSRTLSMARFVEEVKTTTSLWLKTQSPDLNDFYWQRGYGAFSVSKADLPALLRYIDAQEEHHYKEGFQDEYRGFLRQHEIEFDERYVWD